METITREGDREFFRLKDKYADYITSNGEFFKIIDGKRTLVPAPENLSEYVYYKTRGTPGVGDCQEIRWLANWVRYPGVRG